MKHTQGKWKVAEDGYSIYSESACENIYQPCKNFNMITPSQTLKANARLIASAPELLEALKEAQKLFSLARKHFPKSIKNSDTFILENINAMISTVINKVDGVAQ